MYVAHNEAAPAHHGPVAVRGGPIDGGVLANDRPGADLDPGLLAAEFEVLRVAADDRAVADTHVLRQRDVAHQPRARAQPAAVADGDVRPHHHPWPDLDVLAHARRGIDQRRRVDGRAHRLTTRAIISASATTFPST